ncbi:ADM [Bagarius yarrelli]|uniref:ADM n=1 Tax=Bagarius yarrelli TaxID=175774 RepID=A0A556TQW7_BAGYA|nr:ADM [Bagarius yarrelli]
MKKVSESILLWGLLAAFVPCAISVALPSNDNKEKKPDMALEKRDLFLLRSLEDSVEPLIQREKRTIRTPVSQSSKHQNKRRKRGCNLLTCSVHDLAYRISHLSNKMDNAPLHKISPCGYGRRRRRYLPQRSALTLRLKTTKPLL